MFLWRSYRQFRLKLAEAAEAAAAEESKRREDQEERRRQLEAERHRVEALKNQAQDLGSIQVQKYVRRWLVVRQNKLRTEAAICIQQFVRATVLPRRREVRVKWLQLSRKARKRRRVAISWRALADAACEHESERLSEPPAEPPAHFFGVGAFSQAMTETIWTPAPSKPLLLRKHLFLCRLRTYKRPSFRSRASTELIC